MDTHIQLERQLDQLDRQISRLKARNVHLRRENEQLADLNSEFERVCTIAVQQFARRPDGGCPFCGITLPGDHPLPDCLWASAKEALDLKARLGIASKQLGGE